MSAREILRKPYTRVLIPAEEGGFSAEVLEFPGCFAEGESAEEAIRNLEAAAESWIEAALEMGQEIPSPSANSEYSGRIGLRLPPSLHRSAARLADRDDTSLNQFFISAISARVGVEEFVDRLIIQIEERLTPTARNLIIVSDTGIQAWGQLAPMMYQSDLPLLQQHKSDTSEKKYVEVPYG